MIRGEIYRTTTRVAERGYKPGFYVVVFARNEDGSTAICAPVYSQVLELITEVVVGIDDGVARQLGVSAKRCELLPTMATHDSRAP